MKKLLLIIVLAALALGTIITITNRNDNEPDKASDIQSGQSDIIVVTVGPELVDCVGVAPQKCMVVDGNYFYGSIDGFTYEPGFEYNLELRRTKIENPPADASNLQYELIQQLSKTPVDNSANPSSSSLAPIYAYIWQLEQINFSGREPINPNNPTDFELRFNGNNQFSSTTDCNNLMGTFVNQGTNLSFSQIASTRRQCLVAGYESEYTQQLGSIEMMELQNLGSPNPTLILSHSMGSLEFSGQMRDYSQETVSDAQYCSDLKSRIAGSENYVVMTEIANGTTLTNGQEIAGCVYAPNGSYAGWAPFEAQVGTFTITASDGTLLDQGPLSVITDNWMESAMDNQPLKYVADLNFDAGAYTSGTLTLRNENASGLPENDRSVEISVNF